LDRKALVDRRRIASNSAAPQLARRWVGEVCAGLPADLRTDAKLLTSELVTNAVLHASPQPGPQDITVQIIRTVGMLRVEVHDHDPRPPAPVEPPAQPVEGGMGLHLVDRLSSTWGIDATPDGKNVWFEIHTQRERAELRRQPPTGDSNSPTG
jgi:anti-sigma regulatory factor (Ser/Thr protein kinase)